MISSKIDKEVSAHTSHSILINGADELANSATGVAFGSPVDLTSLAGNMVGDEVGEAADYYGKQIKLHASNDPGDSHKKPTPASYSNSIQSTQTAPTFVSQDASANDPLYHLYRNQNDYTSEAFGSMDDADYASAHASHHSQVDHERLMRMQRGAERNHSSRFFARARHNVVDAGELAYGVASGAIDSLDSTLQAFNNSIATGFGMLVAGQCDTDAATHFMHEIWNPQTHHKAWDQLKEGVDSIGVGLSTKYRELSELSPEALGETLGSGAVDAASFFVPGEGEAKGAELLGGARESTRFFKENEVSSTLNPFHLHATHEMTMSKNEFRGLMDSIKMNGIQNPVKYVEHEGKNYVVDGNHRMVAARHLGITNIPVQKVDLPYLDYKKPDDLYYYGGKF